MKKVKEVKGRKPKVASRKKKEESGKKKVTKSEKKSKSSDLRPETLDQKPRSNLTTNLLRIVAVLAVIGITVYIYSIRDRVEEFTQYGYFGIFLIMLLANATVILPAPGVAVVFAMAGVFNPFGVAVAAGAGGAIGELTGYIVGLSSRDIATERLSGKVIIETETYKRISPWINKYGAWVILVLSAIPNPFFDIAGIAAGIAKIPLWQFLLACWVGQTIKMALFAYAGYYSIDWIASFYD